MVYFRQNEKIKPEGRQITLGIVREEVAKNILYYRKERGLTRKALAEKIGVSASAVNNWEIGQNSIDMDTLHTLCKVLNVEMMDIFGKCANSLDHTFSTREKELVYKFRIMNEEGKKYFEKQADYALQQDEYLLKRKEGKEA